MTLVLKCQILSFLHWVLDKSPWHKIPIMI